MFFADFNYDFDTDSIAVVETEVQLRREEHLAVIRSTLRPVGGNQMDDADRLIEDRADHLESVSFEDDQVRQRLSDFFEAYGDIVDSVNLEIRYRRTQKYRTTKPLFDGSGVLLTISSFQQ